MTTTMSTTTFYKLDIQGIVYLVDPTTSIAHTYDLESPTAIGNVVWKDPAVPPQIALYDNWQEILTAKRAAKVISDAAAAATT
jgi:hypothetical protein